MKNVIAIGLSAVLIVEPFSLPGQEAYAGSADNGKRLYVQDGCYECHGFLGQGGAAGSRIAPSKRSTPDLIDYVRRPGGQMPPYTVKVMSDRELTDVSAYLKTIPAPRSVKEIPLLGDLRSK